MSKLRDKFSSLKAEVTKLEQEVKTLNDELQRKRMVLSKEKREEQEREIAHKISDLKLLEKNAREELGKLEQQILIDMQKEVFKIVQDIGKNEGYLLIVGKREAGVIYAPNAIDLTDRVIQKYNASPSSP